MPLLTITRMESLAPAHQELVSWLMGFTQAEAGFATDIFCAWHQAVDPTNVTPEFLVEADAYRERARHIRNTALGRVEWLGEYHAFLRLFPTRTRDGGRWASEGQKALSILAQALLAETVLSPEHIRIQWLPFRVAHPQEGLLPEWRALCLTLVRQVGCQEGIRTVEQLGGDESIYLDGKKTIFTS